MKKSILFFAIIVFVACKKESAVVTIDANPESMNDLNVNDGFNYNTTTMLEGQISVSDLNDNPMQNVRIDIYDEHPDDGGNILNSGVTDAQGIFIPFGVLPTHLTEVVVLCKAMGFPNVQNVAVHNGNISTNFGGSSFKAIDNPGKTQTQNTISSAGDNCYYLSSHNAQGVPSNLMNNNDPIDQSFLEMVNNSLPERAPVPAYNPEYLATGNSTDIKITAPADVWLTFVHEGAGYKNTLGYYVYNTTNPPATAQDIDSIFFVFPNGSYAGSGGGMYSGNKVHLGAFGSNTSIGWVLVQNAWGSNGVDVTKQRFYSNPDFNPENSASNRQHNVQLFDNTRDLVLIGFEDLNRDYNSDDDFNDLIFYVSANPIAAIETINIPTTTENAPDSDKDDIVDSADDFPEDANKAFNNYTNGTLAFEDLWPNQGDYDFNDLVTAYTINQITNGKGQVVEIELDLEVRAVGAAATNALAFELGDLQPGEILSVTGQHITTASVASNGTEQNQSKAVIIAFDDVYDFLDRPKGAFLNTLTTKPAETTKTLNLKVVLANPKSPQSLGFAPFNAFIVAGGIAGSGKRNEIHLPGNTPTSLADQSTFGSAADNTNTATETYYKTNGNLPWAINIASTDFAQVVEFVPIIDAYTKFALWAQTSGNQFPDWYQDKAGYRNEINIFD